MTAQTEAPQAQVGEFGKARLRKEDERLITGQTNWTDNITLPGMLHIAFLRSPYAHARITSVDVSAARGEPGVIAAYSGADFAAEQGSLPCAWPVTPDIVIPAHPPMAVDEVRYVGEAVACVVARDRYAAADALAAIEVDYEQLPPVLDIRTALDEASPKVHEAGNKSYEWVFANGDMEAAFSDAPIVIERTYRQQRLIPAAMEPRAVVCSCVGGEFTLWSATQIPHVLRVMLALVTGIPEQNIRVIAPDVGGGFGSKLQVTAEEVLAMLIARKLGLPVKWTELRSEGNMTVHHGRDQWQRIRIAADSDGRLRGLDVDLLADMGAYLMLVTPGVPLLGAFMFPAIYKMDAYSFKCTGIFTTKMPTDAYRGAGRPEATFAIERMMDELAAHLGVDPLVVRERNWIKHEEFPYTTIATLTYDSGNYEAATARAKELFGYDALRKEQEQRRASDDPVQLGIGISTFTEMCGIAPSRMLGSLAYGAGGWEHASIRMLPTGKVEVVTGSSAHGQGHETAWSQIVADQLGVPFVVVLGLHQEYVLLVRGGDRMAEITVTVDGVKYADHVEPRMLLVHYLREVVGKTGTPIGCDTSNCGACTVLLDGESVKSCAVLAVQADGADITTIQGLANGGLHPLQRAFHEEHALQCGYCTPGMIMAASDLLRENPHPSDEEIREGLEGNLCRCTGYENIVRAVRRAAEAGVSE